MGKTQISKKREKSSKNTSKAEVAVKPRLKAGSPAYDYSAASELANRKFISYPPAMGRRFLLKIKDLRLVIPVAPIANKLFLALTS